ncbi:hypothetical protein GCM10010174_80760 [Kutzneria viridogrisea]|uniref:Uncharacterized protein n=1 Tax=Kutzneria viridogrisea TaxID=47990 RepID=A0ABR6BZ58_9PSEU|nr:hypothetical protein [Kutzneria viridogrisea]
MTIPRIGPGDQPPTTDEVLAVIDQLLEADREDPGQLTVQGVLGIVRTMAAAVPCSCQPADTGYRAPVLHLPTRS